MLLSFVIPILNERRTIASLVEGIGEYAGPHRHEIILINDGSTDGSTEIIDELAKGDPAVKAIHFEDNRGKTAALAAGFQSAIGDVVITMDSDLQDDPKEIPRLLEKLDEGFDLVCGWKKDRRDSWRKTFPSKIYNLVISRLFNLDLHDVNTGYKAMRREVAQAVPLHDDLHRFIPVFADHLGYRVTEIPVEHHPRAFGESKYGPGRFFTAPFDIVSVWRMTRKTSSKKQDPPEGTTQ